jgi:chromosome segregation ATPase
VDLNEEVTVAKDAVTSAKQVLDDSITDEADKQMELGRVNALYEEAKQALLQLEETVSNLSSQVSDLKHVKTKFQRDLESSKVESKKLSVHIDRIVKERASAEREISTLLTNYNWIGSEENAFGIPGGDYDFESCDTNEMAKTLTEMKSEQESLVSHLYLFVSVISRSISMYLNAIFLDEKN